MPRLNSEERARILAMLEEQERKNKSPDVLTSRVRRFGVLFDVLELRERLPIGHVQEDLV